MAKETEIKNDGVAIDNQVEKKDYNPRGKPILKSPKNMAGYAEDKEIDPKLLKVGELVHEAADEDSEPDCCYTEDELMECQDQKEDALDAERERTQS